MGREEDGVAGPGADQTSRLTAAARWGSGLASDTRGRETNQGIGVREVAVRCLLTSVVWDEGISPGVLLDFIHGFHNSRK